MFLFIAHLLLIGMYVCVINIYCILTYMCFKCEWELLERDNSGLTGFNKNSTISLMCLVDIHFLVVFLVFVLFPLCWVTFLIIVNAFFMHTNSHTQCQWYLIIWVDFITISFPNIAIINWAGPIIAQLLNGRHCNDRIKFIFSSCALILLSFCSAD